MKKKVAILLFGLMVLLGACAPKKIENTPEAKPTPKADAIKSVEVENKVEEFEEEVYDFPPSDLACKLPDGFEETENPGEYLYKTYPRDLSSINQVISDGTANPTTKTKEEFKAEIEAEYEDAYGEVITIDITQYDKMTVDGRPGLWIMYNFDFRGDHYEMLMIELFNGIETNYVSFLNAPGSDWMEDFIACAKSMKFLNR